MDYVILCIKYYIKEVDSVKKIKDKIEVLDVKGQGCKDDCPTIAFVPNSSVFQGCGLVIGKPGSANITSLW